MNILKSFFLFLIISLVPSVMLYLVLDGIIFKVMIASFLFTWGVIYFHLDKLVLMQIKAREVVDTDQQLLFQCMKNEAYKTGSTTPKVYLYSGQSLKCFVLQSRNEWSIVFDRRLINEMDEIQLRSLITYLYKFKNSPLCLIQTKVLGIFSLFFGFVYWLLGNVFFLNEQSILYKVLAIFIFMLMKPLILPLEMIAKRQTSLPASLDLMAIYNKAQVGEFSYNDYVFSHLLPVFNTRNLIIDYLEGFPVIKNCRFCEDDIKKYF